MAEVEHEVLVCDNGTGFVKCGFAGEVRTLFYIRQVIFVKIMYSLYSFFFFPSILLNSPLFVPPSLHSYYLPPSQNPHLYH